MKKLSSDECKSKVDIKAKGGKILFKKNDRYDFELVLKIVSGYVEIWYNVKSKSDIGMIFNRDEFSEKFLSGFDLTIDDVLMPLIKHM